MNPIERMTAEEIRNSLRLHNYAAQCVFFGEESRIGFGASTYEAMVESSGRKIADLCAEALNNGGTMTAWIANAFGGDDPFVLLQCEILNSDNEPLFILFK